MMRENNRSFTFTDTGKIKGLDFAIAKPFKFTIFYVYLLFLCDKTES
jgi:hypothetical protein